MFKEVVEIDGESIFRALTGWAASATLGWIYNIVVSGLAAIEPECLLLSGVLFLSGKCIQGDSRIKENDFAL